MPSLKGFLLPVDLERVRAELEWVLAIDSLRPRLGELGVDGVWVPVGVL